MNKKMMCDRIVLYHDDETCTAVLLAALANLNKLKAKMATVKMIHFLTQEVYRTEDLFYQRNGGLRAAVEQAEDFDSYMEPKRRKLEIDRAMV
ncbi:hypothetical protein IV203_030919 [Nitzschia inconspicua]|uniref:Uncharacterized protein n=1 Tax=Nitzschia inconspicua TaxID=303405 RepID=A0A9K3LWW2_9STRA|nr:hypothetical protein IV203_030919 [Nitzschia inconspicua]